MLIKLKDLQVVDFSDDSFVSNEGCETCDYGREFVTDLTIRFSNGTQNTIHMTYNEVVSMSLLIKFFINKDFSDMSKKQFLNNLCNFLKKEHQDYENFKLRKK